ncbi:serine hydrolase [Fictibacillus phosphorivorans]|uniref:serine hydrolase n=1 Tax=Fictibacillus phosphorivorans TaxID=1221500 RepID=UPI00203A7239|nr:serine hydrolase [Fictibacillus phosphorivorans]MCM3718835.1 class A beta-lactamase-related serine hydrolase [Fictibacillus phosphorivorans]MCM3776457.1 class A beta-lactamase-related serine hydrolase [Fictibacillus phosphorivorans]
MLKLMENKLLNLIASGKGTYGVSIYHFNTEEEFVYNQDEEFYAASIIKLPIMSAVFAQVFEGKHSLSDKIQVRREDIVSGDGILKNLTPGMEWTIYDLVVLMIIESDNTATNLLIDLVGMENIQVYMTLWGFKQSQLRHKLQIKPSRKLSESNLITAKEINHFLKNLALGKIVSMNACRKMIKIMKQQKINHLLPKLLPEHDGLIGTIPIWELAHKTGYVPGVEHDVGLFYIPGHSFAISVLSKNVPNREEPIRVMNKLGSLLFEMKGLK